MLFVKVAECDVPDENVEIPVEPQGFILMSTLTAQFPGACGLKFKTEQSSWRGYFRLVAFQFQILILLL